MGRTRSYLALVILVCAVSGLIAGCSPSSESGLPGVSYQVSGKITSSDGTPIDGVQLVITGDTSAVVWTGPDGLWSAVDLTGSCIVTPMEAGWRFTPSGVMVSSSRSEGIDFVGESVLRSQATGQQDLLADASQTSGVAGRSWDSGAGESRVEIQLNEVGFHDINDINKIVPSGRIDVANFIALGEVIVDMTAVFEEYPTITGYLGYCMPQPM